MAVITTALPGAPPQPRGRDISLAALWALLLAVTALWLRGGGLAEVGSVGGFLTSFGRLTGLVASALMLVQVIMMARVPWLERAWGQDELASHHRLIGFTSFNLMLTHIALITLGYAASSQGGLWGTIVDLVVNYPGVLLAVAGAAALVMVVVTSIRAARSRLRYESWHLIHLYAYLGAGLALPHQLWTGQDFLSSRVATIFWWALYAAAILAVIAFRIILPLVRSRRADLRVVDVRAEAPDVTTVTVRGRELQRMGAQGGQFFTWRFADGPGWTRGNPYSLSSTPTDDTLRITVKHLGEGSARLARLPIGTKAYVEGPYGRLHAGVRTGDKVLLLGAGIGITPMRAILESLPPQVSATIVHRVSDSSDLVLHNEIRELAAARGGRYVVLEGHRIPDRQSWLPVSAAHLDDVSALRRLVPDVAEHDVYLCGSGPWMAAAQSAARAAGVRPGALHVEHFAY